MKTLLVPVDSSAAAENTVNVSAEWAKRYEYDRIILLRTYYETLFDDVFVSLEYSSVSCDYKTKEREEATARLVEYAEQLKEKVAPTLKIEAQTSELPLIRAIVDVINEEEVETVMVGSDPDEELNDNLVSGNIITIGRTSPVRVVIIPSNYTYRPIQTVLVPCDMYVIEPVERIRSVRGSRLWNDAEFKVLNVDPKGMHLNKDKRFLLAEDQLHEVLKNVNHTIYYSNEKNIVDGILSFLEENAVDLILALPGKHSFLYSLTHRSISEAIYRMAHQPVLILK